MKRAMNWILGISLFAACAQSADHCVVIIPVAAWIDQDGDSIVDPDELPLPNVLFIADNARTGEQSVSGTISGTDGKADLIIGTARCDVIDPSSDYEIEVTPPDGYKLSTVGPVVSIAPGRDLLLYQYGFQPSEP